MLTPRLFTLLLLLQPQLRGILLEGQQNLTYRDKRSYRLKRNNKRFKKLCNASLKD